MPRGGRRPGAGAPKGNSNALSVVKLYSMALALHTYLKDVPEAGPELRRLGQEAGVLGSNRGNYFEADRNRAITFLYAQVFGGLIEKQSDTIKDNQPNQPPAPSTARAEATSPVPPPTPQPAPASPSRNKRKRTKNN